MSNDIALLSLLNNTLALLLERVDVGQNCELLVQTLNSYFDVKLGEITSSDELLDILSELKKNFGHLSACVKKLRGTKATGSSSSRKNESECTGVDVKQEIPKETKRNNEASGSEDEHSFPNKMKQSSNSNSEHLLSHNPRARHAKLQIEVQEIRNMEEFTEALDNFLKMNEASAKVFENEKNISTKITATKLLVISGILGNLTELSAAGEKCKKYVSELHRAVHPHKDEQVAEIKSVMLINVFVFRFLKEFLGKSVAMLDWPEMYVVSFEIHRELYLKMTPYHSILGKPPATIDRPYPFTDINENNEEKPRINSYISAVNCSGEVFVRGITSTGIIRLTHGGYRTYDVDDAFDVLTISIDCADCETATEPHSQFGEASSQSSTATSCSQAGITCNGKMYILARCEHTENFHCFLFVMDMEGNIEIREELGFLQRGKEGLVRVKIFCVRDKKLVILDVTRRIVHVCDSKGIEKNTIDVSAYMSNTNSSRPAPIFTYKAEMICLESKLNFLSKLNVYDIFFDEEGCSVITKRNEIKLKRAVQAIAFDHKLDRVIVLCYNLSLLHHLVTYSMTGELTQDIELADDKYWQAGVIYHANGPVVLLDNDKMLRLK